MLLCPCWAAAFRLRGCILHMATENGGYAKSQSILIEDCLFAVTENCEAALRRLCQCQVRRVWMDALCINQVNLNERNH